MLEKRIELILECDISIDKDGLRKALTELVKENEGLKRETLLKTREIKKMRDDASKMSAKIGRLTKKIDSVTKNKKELAAPDVIVEDHNATPFEDQSLKDDPLNLLKAYAVPKTLDFRSNSLRLHFSGTLVIALNNKLISL